MKTTAKTEHASNGVNLCSNADLTSYRILNLLPERGNAGAQNVARELTSLLNEENWPSDLVYLDDIGVSFNGSGKLSIKNVILKCRALFYAYIWLRAEKASGNWDVVISHIDRADWLNALTRSSKAKSIIYCHGSKRADLNYRGIFGRLRRWLTNISYSKVDHVICVSNGLRRELITDKIATYQSTSVIMNWLDIKNVIERASHPLPHQYSKLSETKRPIFLSVGRLTLQKEPDSLLTAFKEAHFLGVRPILVFVGDGEMYEDLISLAYSLELDVCEKDDTLQIADVDVIFTGYQSNPMPFIRSSTSFVSTSIWEGLPLVMIEALVMGKHIIVNDCPHGPSEIVELANVLTTSAPSIQATCVPMMSGHTNVTQFAFALERRVQEPSDWIINIVAAREAFSRRTALSKIQAVIRQVVSDR